ncbi:MAG: gamma-glutamylcyclotransferase [Afipia sp.]|nr:gamma-glutamylcyclotransferase [Afipia sp.]
MPRVFVYGTLKRGFRNFRFLENSLFVGEAYTLTRYRMLDGRFPVLRDSGPDLRQVSGEVFDIDDRTLATLDELESVGIGMYERVETDVMLSGDGGQAARAFIYVGCRAYWDKKEQVPYCVTDERGHLDWIAPAKRNK